MSNDWNTAIINEFRANGGSVGGQFEGAPLILLHHVGRKSGQPHVNPTMYLQDPTDPKTLYVFATLGGAPNNPAWYYNVRDAGRAQVETGSETYDVTATELTGADRDRVYAEQARRIPGFAAYERRTAGIRVIPVFALRRD